MRRIIALLVVTVLLLSAGLAQAASNDEKRTAIQNGLAWLASTQQADGSWSYGNNGTRGATAAALLAFSEQKLKTESGGWFGVDYSGVVDKAANYLLQQTKLFTFPAPGNNGFTGSGYGFEWYGNDRNRSTYESGLTIPALARYSSNLPNGGVGNTIASTNANVNGKTYAEVIQRGVDSFVWGQRSVANGVYRGGWRYHPQWTDADNSTAQWPVIGMLYAQALANTSVPATTKSELQYWINYIQNTNGGSGYNSPTYLVNEAKTGGLLIEMDFAGGGNKSKALEYLNTYWKTTANSTWDGNFGHPYAMWSIYKGLESTIGLDDTSVITNLNANPGDLDPDQKWGWWEDYCESLVNSQNPNGSWNGYSEWYGAMATAWNINILNATEIPPQGCPPGSPCVPPTPLSGTVVLLGSGLLGLGVLRRRLKK